MPVRRLKRGVYATKRNPQDVVVLKLIDLGIIASSTCTVKGVMFRKPDKTQFVMTEHRFRATYSYVGVRGIV